MTGTTIATIGSLVVGSTKEEKKYIYNNENVVIYFTVFLLKIWHF